MAERYNNLLSILSQESNSNTLKLYEEYGSMFGSYEEFRNAIHGEIDNHKPTIFESDPQEIVDEMKKRNPIEDEKK